MILNLTDSTGRLARWRHRSLKFDFDVILCAGIKHKAAHTLSGLFSTGNDASPLKDELVLLAVDHSKNANASDSTEHSYKHCLANIDIDRAATDKSRYDLSTLLKYILAQKNVIFCRT